MRTTTSKSPYIEGVMAGAAFVLVVMPFGVLFGVVAAESGLALIQTMAMTVVVIAGASQLAAVQLMSENAPIWAVLAASLTVNLRMAMYSASLQPYFRNATLRQRLAVAFGNFDQSYALSILKYEGDETLSLSGRLAFYFGVVTVIASSWVVATWIGAAFGSALLPEGLPLDYAMPIMFLAIVSPMLKSPAHLAAAFTSIVVALLLSGLPSGAGLLVAGLAAMAAGAEVERRGFGP